MNARLAVLDALTRCRRNNAWSADVLDAVIKKYNLDTRDAALTSAIFLGVLQNKSLCDYYINFYCPHKLEPQVRDILRIGTYQLVFMDKIPARAAVDECVKLSNRRTSGLINAVLRQIAENNTSLPQVQASGTASHLSFQIEAFPDSPALPSTPVLPKVGTV